MATVAPAEKIGIPVASTRPPPLTVAEYFAGIGLFRMGLEAAGWRVVYANDWNAKRAQIYRGFFHESYRVEDIFSVALEDIPQVMLATCSFPCVDLSLAGKGEGLNGNHSGAFGGFHKILKKQGKNSPPHSVAGKCRRLVVRQ